MGGNRVFFRRADNSTKWKSNKPFFIVTVSAGPSQYQIGIRNRGINSSLPVTCGTWIGSGTQWSNQGGTAFVNQGNGSAAGTDLDKINEGITDRIATPLKSATAIEPFPLPHTRPTICAAPSITAPALAVVPPISKLSIRSSPKILLQ